MFDDPTDNYLAAELKYILNHRYLSGIFELKVTYSSGEIEWHTLSLVKNDDAHTTSNYIVANDLDLMFNGIHMR